MPGSAPAGPDLRLARLERILAGYGPTLVAFSGGVDSTLVAVAAQRALGDRALAVTGVSPSLAASERALARDLATQLGLRHREIETRELELAGYQANAGDRCYWCKGELFARLEELAAAEGFAAIATGDNPDDLGGHRPGLVAAAEHRVRHPLVEAGLDKAAIRELARGLGLPNHEKPAAPCLSSRIPDFTPVDLETLERIEAAEAAVRALGFRVFRVRHHGELARLEVGAPEHATAYAAREALAEAIRGAGYRWVSLDLTPFRSGSASGRGEGP